MKIIMKSTAAGPDGGFASGRTYVVGTNGLTEEMALAFVEGGYALAVDETAAKPAPAVGSAETPPAPLAEPVRPEKLTVAELAALLRERGVDVPAGAKKADLVALYETAAGAPAPSPRYFADEEGTIPVEVPEPGLEAWLELPDGTFAAGTFDDSGEFNITDPDDEARLEALVAAEQPPAPAEGRRG